MSIKLTIGSKIITIPENGASPSWGQGIVAAFQAIASQLQGISSTFDIPPSVQTLTADANANLNVNTALFPSDQVRAFTYSYAIYKVNGVISIAESGTIRGVYDSLNANWTLTHVFSGPRLPSGAPYNTFAMVGDQLTLSTLPIGGAYNPVLSNITYSAKVVLAKGF